MDERVSNSTAEETKPTVHDFLDQQRQRMLASVESHQVRLTALELELDHRLQELMSDLETEEHALEERARSVAKQLAEIADREAGILLAEEELERRRGADESELAAQRSALEQKSSELAEKSATLEARSTELDEKSSDLDAKSAEIEGRQAELEKKQNQFAKRQTAIEAQQSQLVRDQQAAREYAKQESAELDRRREELHEHQEQLERERSELAEDRALLNKDRGELTERNKNAHRDLREKRDALKAEREAFREECREFEADQERQAEQLSARAKSLDLQRAALDRREHELTTRAEQLASQEQRQKERTADLERLSQELADREKWLDSEQNTLEQQRDELERLREEIKNLRDAQDRSADARQRAESERISELEAQHETLHEKLVRIEEERDASTATIESMKSAHAELKKALEDARFESETLRNLAEHPVVDSEERRDLERRNELLIDDLREAKAEINALKQELAKARTSGGDRPKAAVTGVLDWEAQKMRLLAALESEPDDSDPEEHEERLRMEEIVRTTDAAIQERELEISELRQLLEQQSANIGEVAVGAAAIAAQLDGDEIVVQERERLQELQREWREKLRVAEVDISVERARIARERAELEEKLRSYESDVAQHRPGDSGPSDPKNPKKPVRRWLERLGLKDNGASS